MTTDHIDRSVFADADNLNIGNENRVLGRDTFMRAAGVDGGGR
jgi:hypothetical protein